jgi:hypothetical protein
MTMPAHCRGCVMYGTRGTGNEKQARRPWCSAHSTYAERATSICIQQGTKRYKIEADPGGSS